MRLGLCFFVIISVCNSLVAQIQFSKAFDSNHNHEWGFSIINKNDTFMVLSGLAPISNIDNESLMFDRIDSSGNLISSSIYYIPDTAYFPGTSGALKQNGNQFILGTSSGTISQFDQSAILVKFDQNGQVILKKYYDLDTLSIGYSTVLFSNGDFGIVGLTYHLNSRADVLFIRTDSLGNVKWIKKYGGGYDDQGLLAYEQPNGDILISALEFNTQIQKKRDWFITLDDTGAVKNSFKYTYHNSTVWCSTSITPTANNQYILWGFADTLQQSNNGYWPLHVTKVDSDYHIIWQTLYLDSFDNDERNIKQINDGGFVVVGTVAGGRGLIFKIDSFGHLLWHHWYQYSNNTCNYFSDFVQLSNGDLVVTGVTDDCDSLGSNEDMWLVRLNSEGCLVPGCFSNGTVEVTSKINFMLFPNPAENELQVQLNVLGAKPTSFQIINMFGQTILQGELQNGSNHLNILSLLPGIYLFQIQAVGKLYTKKFVKE